MCFGGSPKDVCGLWSSTMPGHDYGRTGLVWLSFTRRNSVHHDASVTGEANLLGWDSTCDGAGSGLARRGRARYHAGPQSEIGLRSFRPSLVAASGASGSWRLAARQVSSVTPCDKASSLQIKTPLYATTQSRSAGLSGNLAAAAVDAAPSLLWSRQGQREWPSTLWPRAAVALAWRGYRGWGGYTPLAPPLYHSMCLWRRWLVVWQPRSHALGSTPLAPRSTLRGWAVSQVRGAPQQPTEVGCGNAPTRSELAASSWGLSRSRVKASVDGKLAALEAVAGPHHGRQSCRECRTSSCRGRGVAV